LHYVYLLQSVSTPTERYTGRTDGLRKRLRQHNTAKEGHTAKFRPWRVVTYLGFSEAKKAAAFERYIKQGSGHAFANKHLW